MVACPSLTPLPLSTRWVPFRDIESGNKDSKRKTEIWYWVSCYKYIQSKRFLVSTIIIIRLVQSLKYAKSMPPWHQEDETQQSQKSTYLVVSKHSDSWCLFHYHVGWRHLLALLLAEVGGSLSIHFL
jgi:hypothetical protein